MRSCFFAFPHLLFYTVELNSYENYVTHINRCVNTFTYTHVDAQVLRRTHTYPQHTRALTICTHIHMECEHTCAYAHTNEGTNTCKARDNDILDNNKFLI